MKKKLEYENSKKRLKTMEELETLPAVAKLKQIKFREQEEFEIQEFMQSDSKQKFLMITGQPGSGKTLLLTKFYQEWSQKRITIYINAMSCKNYGEFLNLCAKQLKIKTQQNLTSLKQKFKEVLTEEDVIIIIDEFDNLFKVSEKDAFDLFALSKISTIIGISNDIEFLQSQSAKMKFQLPKLKNVILKPYTVAQLSELVIDKLHQLEDIQFDVQTVKLLATRGFNDKGGDMRNILDILKRTLRNGKELTVECINAEVGLSLIDNQMKAVIESLTLHQKLIILGMGLLLKAEPVKMEADMPDLIRKVNEIKYKMNLNCNISVEEEVNLLKDYNILDIKECKQQKMGFRFTMKKVLCKFTSEEIKYQFSNQDAFKNILQLL